jgi:hypothetical protein
MQGACIGGDRDLGRTSVAAQWEKTMFESDGGFGDMDGRSSRIVSASESATACSTARP